MWADSPATPRGWRPSVPAPAPVGHVRDRAARIPHDLHVVRDRSGPKDLQHRERRAPAEYHGLADVLQREPYLPAVRSDGDVGAKRTLLGDPADDLVILHPDHHRLRGEGGADVTVLAVGGEDLHARSAGYDDPGLLFVGVSVQDRSEEHTSELQSQSNLVCR